MNGAVRVHSGFRVHQVCIKNADLALRLPTGGYDFGKMRIFQSSFALDFPIGPTVIGLEGRIDE